MGDTLEIFGTEYTNVAGFKVKDDNGNVLVYTRGGSGGTIDAPTFTVIWNDAWDTVLSVTCDKTFAECDSYCENGIQYGAVVETDQSQTWTGYCTAYWWDQHTDPEDPNESYIVYTVFIGSFPEIDIKYNGDGTFITTNPSVQQVTLNITQNGTYYPSGVIQEVNVAVPPVTPTLQTKSVNITPSETAQSQTVTADSGYDGLDEVSVSVGAISSSYVGSGITRRSSSDLTASGATVSVPAGYYESAGSKAVSSGSATAPASISGTSATVSTGTNTLTLSKTVSVTPTVSPGYVSSGTAGNASVSLTASVTTKAATTIHPSTSDQTIASGTYLTGAQTIKAVTLSNLTADNIKSGVTVTVGDSTDADCVTSVTGTYSGGGTAKNIQVYSGYATTTATSYTATSVTITVAKTGTYNVSWMGYRNTTSGTSGSQLYRTRNGTATAIGNASTTFVNSYGQSVSLSNQSFNQGDILVVRARARSAQYIMGVGNLIIEEV